MKRFLDRNSAYLWLVKLWAAIATLLSVRPQIICGRIVDLHRREIYPGSLLVMCGRILRIKRLPDDAAVPRRFIMPGFVNAHVHVESSLLTPNEFARLIVRHGTVATVSDPHEIANPLGSEGIWFMIRDGLSSPFKFYFGIPSCVPASPFETSGAEITVEDIEHLAQTGHFRYLAEMMAWPLVLQRDPLVMRKLSVARRFGLSIDGHYPKGDNPNYFYCDDDNPLRLVIQTDHEATNRDEARNKLRHGAKILIREGSAARNFKELIELLREFPGAIMFCSDDSHPDFLAENDVRNLVLRALRRGLPLWETLRAACVNPVEHYRLDVGLLRRFDPADFIVVRDLENFEIEEVYINGRKVAERQGDEVISLIPRRRVEPINNFDHGPIAASQLEVAAKPDSLLRVIKTIPGELLTEELLVEPPVHEGLVVADTGPNDILKLVVLNRYDPAARPFVAFVNGFRLKRGAIASSVGHDCHNIVAVGTNDDDLAAAINAVIAAKGGLALADTSKVEILPLPVAGILSDEDAFAVTDRYRELDRKALELCEEPVLPSLYMALSFLPLLVIGDLKAGDKGLYNGMLEPVELFAPLPVAKV